MVVAGALTIPVSGDTDDVVVDTIRAHMSPDHPALLETVSQDDLLGWIQVEQLDLEEA